MVLRQDVIISTSKLRFERLSEKEAAEIDKSLLNPPGERRRGRGYRQGRGRGEDGSPWRGRSEGAGAQSEINYAPPPH